VKTMPGWLLVSNNGFIVSSYSNKAGEWHDTKCRICGERRGTCRDAGLLRVWEDNHRKRCHVPATYAPPCRKPGCLYCGGM